MRESSKQIQHRPLAKFDNLINLYCHSVEIALSIFNGVDYDVVIPYN